jgi:hypothetical protein
VFRVVVNTSAPSPPPVWFNCLIDVVGISDLLVVVIDGFLLL